MQIVSAHVGQWYESQEVIEKFEVVAIDEQPKNVYVQFLSGNIDGFDLSEWQAIHPSKIQDPEELFEDEGQKEEQTHKVLELAVNDYLSRKKDNYFSAVYHQDER